MAPRPARVSMAARRRTRCSNAASIVSRRAVGNSADQRTSNCGGGSQAGSGSLKRPVTRSRQSSNSGPKREESSRRGKASNSSIRQTPRLCSSATIGSGRRRASRGREGREQGAGSGERGAGSTRWHALRGIPSLLLPPLPSRSVCSPRTTPGPTPRRACRPRRREAAGLGRATRRGSARPAPLRRRTNGRHS